MGVVFLPQNKQEALHKFIEIHFSPDNEYMGNILVMVTGNGKTTPHLVGAFAANEEAADRICNIIKSKSCGYYIRKKRSVYYVSETTGNERKNKGNIPFGADTVW